MYTNFPLVILALASVYLTFVYVLLTFAKRNFRFSRSRSSVR